MFFRESFHPLRQLGKLPLRHIHLATQLRALLLFGFVAEPSSWEEEEEPHFGVPSTPREAHSTCAGIATPSGDSTHQPRAQERKVEQWTPEAEGENAFPWDIHLPHFVKPFLDASVHAAPEQDESCSALVQGAERNWDVPYRKHVLFVGQSILPEWAKRFATISTQVSHQLVTAKHAPLHHKVEQMNRNSNAIMVRLRQVSNRPPRFTPNHHRVPLQPTHQQNHVPFILSSLSSFSLAKKEVGVLLKQAARGDLRRLIHTVKRNCRLRALLHIQPWCRRCGCCIRRTLVPTDKYEEIGEARPQREDINWSKEAIFHVPHVETFHRTSTCSCLAELHKLSYRCSCRTAAHEEFLDRKPDLRWEKKLS